MTTPLLILTYVLVLLGTLSCLGVYTELRKRRFKPSVREDKIFRCDKCGCVYTDDPDVERSRCSQCGKMNATIQF